MSSSSLVSAFSLNCAGKALSFDDDSKSCMLENIVDEMERTRATFACLQDLGHKFMSSFRSKPRSWQASFSSWPQDTRTILRDQPAYWFIRIGRLGRSSETPTSHGVLDSSSGMAGTASSCAQLTSPQKLLGGPPSPHGRGRPGLRVGPGNATCWLRSSAVSCVSGSSLTSHSLFAVTSMTSWTEISARHLQCWSRGPQLWIFLSPTRKGGNRRIDHVFASRTQLDAESWRAWLEAGFSSDHLSVHFSFPLPEISLRRFRQQREWMPDLNRASAKSVQAFRRRTHCALRGLAPWLADIATEGELEMGFRQVADVILKNMKHCLPGAKAPVKARVPSIILS